MTNNKQQTEINAVEYLGKVNQFAKENNTGKPKQQTAVEWLVEQLPLIQQEGLRDIIEQAKEMEKEQAQHWFKFGMLLVEGHLWKPVDKFEQYYNENHEQNNQSNQEHI
jgi:hypothetical protein